MTHTEIKPFPCTLCTKSFKQGGDLKRHMRTPFQCTVCTKSFTYAGVLKKHMKTHSGQKLYPCTVCSKSFISSEN